MGKIPLLHRYTVWSTMPGKNENKTKYVHTLVTEKGETFCGNWI